MHQSVYQDEHLEQTLANDPLAFATNNPIKNSNPAGIYLPQDIRAMKRATEKHNEKKAKQIRIFNAHVHAREAQTDEFAAVVPLYIRDSAAVYMMNFPEPVQNSEAVKQYQTTIENIAWTKGNPDHLALMMPVLANTMSPMSLESFIRHMQSKRVNLAGFKLFTQGQSTNSGYAPDIKLAQKLIDVVEAYNLPLTLHMEDPDEPNASMKEVAAIDRVLPQFIEKNGQVRNMKISVEHISTNYALKTLLSRYDNVNFTITPHHMAFNQEMFEILNPEMAEVALREYHPFYFCKPLIQTHENQEALLDYWLNSNSDRLMLGTDSAPHLQHKKKSANPPAGIFMGGTKRSYEFATKSKTIQPQLNKYSDNAAKFYNVNLARLPIAPNSDGSIMTNGVKNIISHSKAGR